MTRHGDEQDVGSVDAQAAKGAPGGARQHVRAGTEQGAVARPGGATQNSGGALSSYDEEEHGHGPGRGAD